MASSTAGVGYDHLLKLLLIGDSGCGKTSILLSFVQNDFRESTRSTIGVDLKIKLYTLNDKTFKLTIWDTAGQERFRTLTSSYYRGAHGIICVYDVTSRESFDNIEHWLSELDIYSEGDAVRMLIGNKIDLVEQRQVSRKEGSDLAREKGMLFCEASAKTSEGIATAFKELLLKIEQSPTLLSHSNASSVSSVRLSAPNDIESEQLNGCAC